MTYFPPSNGIFQGIIRNMAANNRSDNIIIKASSNLGGYPPRNAIDLVNIDSYWLSEPNQNYIQWLSVELTDRWVSLTNFVLRSRVGYFRNFDFSVSTDGSNWEVILSIENSDFLSGLKAHIYSVPPVVARFFKFTQTGPNSEPSDPTRFRISGIDLYGSIIPCYDSCNETIPSLQNMPIYCATSQQFIFSQGILFAITALPSVN